MLFTGKATGSPSLETDRSGKMLFVCHEMKKGACPAPFVFYPFVGETWAMGGGSCSVGPDKGLCS